MCDMFPTTLHTSPARYWGYNKLQGSINKLAYCDIHGVDFLAELVSTNMLNKRMILYGVGKSAAAHQRWHAQIARGRRRAA